MEKLDLGDVKKTTRIKKGVEQTIRLFTKTQRQLIMKAVDNRPDDMTIEDVLNMYDVSPVVYYTWVRNDKEDRKGNKEEKESSFELPNPLLESSIINNVFSSAEQLKAFYLENSPELKAFIEKKFQEWAEKDIIAQISSKVTSENLVDVAKAGNITTDELISFLKRENKDISYFAVDGIKRFLGI